MPPKNDRTVLPRHHKNYTLFGAQTLFFHFLLKRLNFFNNHKVISFIIIKVSVVVVIVSWENSRVVKIYHCLCCSIVYRSMYKFVSWV